LSHHLRNGRLEIERVAAFVREQRLGRMILRIEITPSAARSRRLVFEAMAAGEVRPTEIIGRRGSTQVHRSGRHRSELDEVLAAMPSRSEQVPEPATEAKRGKSSVFSFGQAMKARKGKGQPWPGEPTA